MADVEVDPDKLRYIAGLVPGDEMRFLLFAVLEENGERIAGPQQITHPMTREQAEHLHLQLSNALGFASGVPIGAEVSEP